jgi:hypothetical protein
VSPPIKVFSEILWLGAGLLLSGESDYLIQASEPPRTALGLSNPDRDGWVT